MSQPADPYRGDRRDHRQQPDGYPPGQPSPSGAPRQEPPGHREPWQSQPPRHQEPWQPEPNWQPERGRQPEPNWQPAPTRQQPAPSGRPMPPATPYAWPGEPPTAYGAPPQRSQAQHRPPGPAARWRPRLRLPGLGLLLALLGLAVQVISLTVLPWARFGEAGLGSAGLPEIATELGTNGFGGLYTVLFSYPLAALGILLALASALESVALKLIWGGLALIGLAIVVLRYGLGPFAGLVTDDAGLHFTTAELTLAVVALSAVVVVIFMLRMAVKTFRRVAGLILLGLGGLHVAAVSDLLNASSAEQLDIGAFGPALGYLLSAAAAFVGPARFLRP